MSASTSQPQFEILHDSGDPTERSLSAAALAKEVNAFLTGPMAAELGTLSPGPVDHDGHPANWPGLRTRALPGFGGAEFHHNLGSGDIGTLGASYIAPEIQQTLDGLERHRSTATAAIKAARDLATATIDACDTPFSPPRLVAMTFSAKAPAGLAIGMDIEILSHDLTRRVIPLRRMTTPGENAGLPEALAAHERRVMALAVLRASRLRGWIDETARRVLAATAIDVDEAIEQLRILNGFTVQFGKGRWTARLMWHDGVIRADIHDRATGIGMYDGQLPLGAGLPDVLFDSLPGRRLGEVADVEHPFLSPDAMITNAFKRSGERFATLAVPIHQLPDGTR